MSLPLMQVMLKRGGEVGLLMDFGPDLRRPHSKAMWSGLEFLWGVRWLVTGTEQIPECGCLFVGMMMGGFISNEVF